MIIKGKIQRIILRVISTQNFDYKPFGDTLNAGGESRIGYAAQERDEESRYFAMGARQYDQHLDKLKHEQNFVIFERL